MCIYKCIYIPYNMLSVYNISCIYIISADHLVLNKEVECSSLRRTIYSTLIIPYYSVVFVWVSNILWFLFLILLEVTILQQKPYLYSKNPICMKF